MLRAIILIAVLVVVKGEKCMQRAVGSDAIVCVCNATYCDSVPEVRMQEGQYVMYTSTKSGKRMEISSGATYSTDKLENSLLLTVNSNQKYQEILGFGGAMTDAAALNIRSLSNAAQRNLLESYFGRNGSRYTLCRIPIAGTDFSTRPYTYDDVPNDVTLSNFSLVEEDDYKIRYLHDIKNVMSEPDSLKILTIAWSAPAWMKSTNSITWGFLKPEYYQVYANYFKKFFDAYNERGIDIWGVTPGNEPSDGFFPSFPFNAMGWTSEAVANWTTDFLAPTLSKAGYNPTYIAMDDQRFKLPYYVEDMFDNPKAKELFKGIAVHWYVDSFVSPFRLNKTHDEYPDKFILMTEACTGSSPLDKEKVKLGDWKRGEKYISNIIENLSHWMTGWVDWNLALNKHGAPNWAKNFADSSIIVMPESDEFYKQPMFYAISHFSHFVPRDSYRIDSRFNVADSNTKIDQIAFDTSSETVIVINNKNDENRNITIMDEKKVIQIHLPLLPNSFVTEDRNCTPMYRDELFRRNKDGLHVT